MKDPDFPAALPLISAPDEGRARSLMQLVGRQLYDGYYVWSWPLPSAPEANGHEFAVAEEKIGVRAIYEAADMLLPFRDGET